MRLFQVLLLGCLLLLAGCPRNVKEMSCADLSFKITEVAAVRNGAPQSLKLGSGDSLRASDRLAVRVQTQGPLWINIWVVEETGGRLLWPAQPQTAPLQGALRIPLDDSQWLELGRSEGASLCVLASRVPLRDGLALCRAQALPGKTCVIKKPGGPERRGGRGGDDGEADDQSSEDKEPAKDAAKEKEAKKDDPPPNKGPDSRPTNPQGLGIWERVNADVIRVKIAVQDAP